MRKSLLSFLVCSLLLAGIISSQALNWATAENPNLTTVETQVMNKINGTNAYNYDLELENMTLNHTISGYSFRSSGSVGANASAEWIQQQFESFGLETHAEAFQFTTWNVMTKPVFKVDLDGNSSTTDDEVVINSFQPEHYSLPTPDGGVYAQLVTLPMPVVSSQEGIAGARYDPAGWLTVNTTGKILFVGREIRGNSHLALAFRNKLDQQPPAALIFTWWYNWMSWVPPMFGSVGGRPASQFGAYLWNLHLPVGWVSYEDGQWVRSALANNTNISAQVIVNASITQGPHYNVVGKLQGSSNPEKMIIISAHYDSVVTPAFCDNGAGIAGVLELARVFSDASRTGEYRPPYTLVFVAFTGEELGFVGSINYLKQHADEMKDVAAVINIDCIGSRTFQITETTTDDNGLNLQNIVMKAGQDLNVYVNHTEPGGSDQETFRVPSVADEEYRYIWGSDAGIANATRVKSSIMISSIPIFYSDTWTDIGAPGWIHTPYDNSTSTSTLDWVGIDRLQTHIQVTGLSVIRVLSAATSPFLMEVYVGAAVAGVVATILIYVERTKVYIFMKRLRHEILVDFGIKELVVVVFLTGVFMFLSFAFFMRLGRDEAIVSGFPAIVTYRYYGKPFEMISVMDSSIGVGGGGDSGEGLQVIANPGYSGSTNVLLSGLMLNAIIFGLLSFLTVFAVVKLRYMWEYSRSSDLQQDLEEEE
jgi:hypothetical protein